MHIHRIANCNWSNSWKHDNINNLINRKIKIKDLRLLFNLDILIQKISWI